MHVYIESLLMGDYRCLSNEALYSSVVIFLQDPVVAEKILSAVDTFGNALVTQLKSSERNSTSIVKPNIAIEVMLATQSDIVYPRLQETVEEAESWVNNVSSSIYLTAGSLGS